MCLFFVGDEVGRSDKILRGEAGTAMSRLCLIFEGDVFNFGDDPAGSDDPLLGEPEATMSSLCLFLVGVEPESPSLAFRDDLCVLGDESGIKCLLLLLVGFF